MPVQKGTRAQAQGPSQRPCSPPWTPQTEKVATTTTQSHLSINIYDSNSKSKAISKDIYDDDGVGNNEAVGGAALSFAQRAGQQVARAPTPMLVKGDRHLLRDIERPPPGDPSTQPRPRRRSLLPAGSAGGATACAENDSAGPVVARKRSQYFEDAFSARDADTSPAKERVRCEAPVLAEVRTNVIVGDEFTVVTELCAHLALRYRRPLSSVVVTLQHGACMCFGGSFAPAYVMTVAALPAQLQPATNKRNAALIQRHMEEALGVPPARGHVQFVAVPEANLAYGGKTAVGHADDLAKAGSSSNNSNSNSSSSSSSGGGGGSNSGINDTASHVNDLYRSPTGSGGSGSAGVLVDPGSLSSERRKNRTARRLSVKSLSSFRVQPPPELTPPPSAVDEQTPAALAALSAIPEGAKKDEASVRVGDKNKTHVEAAKSSSLGKQAEPAGREKEGAPARATLASLPLPPKPPKPPKPSKPPQPTQLPSPPTSPTTAMARQPSRRARRTKSFVATLFGRATTKLEGTVM